MLLMEIAYGQTYYYKEVIPGYDFEAGVKFPFFREIGDLRFYVGYYEFKSKLRKQIYENYYEFNAKMKEHIRGLKYRVEYRPCNIVRLSYETYER